MKSHIRSLLRVLPAMILLGLPAGAFAFQFTVDTTAPTFVDAYSATFNGTLVPAFGSVWFEYGPTGSTGTSPYTLSTPHQPATAMFTASVRGLKPVTGYHFRAAAQTPGSAVVYGSEQIFTTPAAVAITVDAQMVTSLLLKAGQSGVSLSVTAHGSSPLFQWLKGAAPVVGATGTTYAFPTITTTMAGSYACRVSNPLNTVVSSPVTAVAVASISPATDLLVKDQGTFTLTASLSPADPAATYAWSSTNSPNLDTVGTVTGKSTPLLKVTSAVIAPQDSYQCVISSRGSMVTVSVNVTVVAKPVISAIKVSPLEVGQLVTIPLTISNLPTSVTVTGLPPGLTLKKSVGAAGVITGFVSGRTLAPTTSTGVTVTVNASNVAGPAAPVTFSIDINALNRRTVQTTFNGLVDRDPAAADNGNNGGALTNLVITSTGAYSGVLSLGTLAPIRFAGQLDTVLGSNPTSTAILIGLLLPAVQKYTLDFTIDESTGKLTGTLQKNGDSARATPVTAWGNPYSTAHPAPALAGLHNFWMDPPSSVAGATGPPPPPPSPQGSSIGSATVNALGVVTISATMADGWLVPAVTTTIGPNGDVFVHAILYNGHGAVHGGVVIVEQDDATLPPLKYHAVSGGMSWNKTGASSTTDHTYETGFDFGVTNTAFLNVQGSGQSVEPGVIFWDIPDLDPAIPNAEITFSDAGVTDSTILGLLNAPFHIVAAGFATGPKATTNFDIITGAGAGGGPHVKRTLVLNGITGAFNGTFTLFDTVAGANGPVPVTRVATFKGVVAPGLRSGNGFFTLVQLPGTPTSSVKSGKVKFNEFTVK